MNKALSHQKLYDIDRCSQAKLQSLFEPLDKYKDHVFWIRDREMTRQIYTSNEYQSVWGRDQSVLYEMPMLWLQYLDKEDINSHMQQLQCRHDKRYVHRKESVAFYQILTPDNDKRNICCQAIKCDSVVGEQYIIGIARSITYKKWIEQYRISEFPINNDTQKAHDLFLKLLKNNFGIMELTQDKTLQSSLKKAYEAIFLVEKVKFSQREIECLYKFCLGKTAKTTAKEMNLSHRTVEEYLYNIKLKTQCSSKIDVVSRFSRYFN